jgi:signal transduction histidine kinase
MLLIAHTSRRVIKLADAAARDRAALAETLAAKAALMRGVTHDLKNPLGAALGYVELLEDGMLGTLAPHPLRVVTRVKGLIASTLRAVEDLLELARAESTELALEREHTDVAALVTDIVADYAVAARANELSIEAHVPDGPIAIETDARRVRQILGNLLSNAVKYTPRGGRVAVAASADEARGVVRVTVSDTGRGIPEQYRERVFEEFFRLPTHDDDDAAAPRGNGVGLAISRRLARRLGGDVTVDRAEMGGAAFTLVLPLPSSRAQP